MNDRAVKQLLSALTGQLEEMDAPSQGRSEGLKRRISAVLPIGAG